MLELLIPFPVMKTTFSAKRLPNRTLFKVATLLLLLSAASGVTAQRQTLRGHVPLIAPQLQPIGRLPAANRLDLAIGLPFPNQEGITTLLQQIDNPTSTN